MRENMRVALKHLYFSDFVGPCFTICDILTNYLQKNKLTICYYPTSWKALNINDITCTSFSRLIKSSFLAAAQYAEQKQSAVTKISWQADGEMKVANKL